MPASFIEEHGLEPGNVYIDIVDHILSGASAGFVNPIDIALSGTAEQNADIIRRMNFSTKESGVLWADCPGGFGCRDWKTNDGQYATFVNAELSGSMDDENAIYFLPSGSVYPRQDNGRLCEGNQCGLEGLTKCKGIPVFADDSDFGGNAIVSGGDLPTALVPPYPTNTDERVQICKNHLENLESGNFYKSACHTFRASRYVNRQSNLAISIERRTLQCSPRRYLIECR